MDEIALTSARRLTERIRLMAMTVGENVDKLKALVTEAKESGAHVALGYASWPAYLADVLGETPMRLERDTRQALVAELHGQGMSTRAIAPIVGVTHETVAQDIKAPVRNLTPAEPEAYWSPEESFVGAHPFTGEIIEPETRPEPAETVTGLDGKHYPRTEPKEPRRKALTDTAKDVGWELRKATDKLLRMQEDDRFTRNKEEVAAHIRGHLMFTVEACQELLDILNQSQED